MRLLPPLAALLLAAPPARATPAVPGEAPKLAVLEFETSKGVAVDRSYFSDKVRAIARQAAPHLFVMTRESVEVLLQAQGTSLAACQEHGACEVEIARLMGADYVVSGRMVRVGALRLTLRLHRSATGELLTSTEAKGRSPGELADAVEAAARALLAPLVEAGGSPAQPAAPPAPAAGYVKIRVSPARAAASARVSLDGRPAGPGRQGPYPPGDHTLRVEAAGHRAAEQAVFVHPGAVTPVSLSLVPLPGMLLVSVNVAAECDAGGLAVPAAPDAPARLVLTAGPANVTCAAEGFEPASVDAEVEADKSHLINLTLQRLPARAGAVEPKSGLRFAAVPGGAFVFQRGEAGQRPVAIPPFRLGELPVTVAAWERCVRAGACTEPDIGGACNWRTDRREHPVNCVDWGQATAFCRWIGGALPTEEEREYAASGGSEGRAFPWGDHPPRLHACWDGEGSELGRGRRRGTCPAGSHRTGDGRWGLKDLAGNVAEWTSSEYDATSKVIRGGAWPFDYARQLGARYRNRADRSLRQNHLGVRCKL